MSTTTSAAAQFAASTELNEFVELLLTWHNKKEANLRDVQEGAKEGALLKIGDDEKGIPLTGREALFLKLGIEVALIELGKLPFKVTRNDDYDDEEGCPA